MTASAPQPGPARNLLDIPWVRAFLKSPLYPGIFAYPVLVVFGYIVYALLWGPSAASANVGTSLTWVLWWPLIPIAMFTLGRFWCAICPFGTLIDVVGKAVGLGRPVPGFLKRYGIWIIDATFILITWSDHVFGVVENPRGSGYLLGAMATAAVVTAVLYQRRTWCRYLCFLGGLNGNYARASMIELRATPDICATCTTQSCYKGSAAAPGCPVFEFPRMMQTSANCNFCANCVKSCPNDSIRISTRPPTRELWFMNKPKFEESFLASVIVGIVIVQNVTMIGWWGGVLERLTALLLGSEALAFTAAFIVAMVLPIAVIAAAAHLSARHTGETWKKNFARFGYAVIALDLAGHIAHNLFHLLSEGKSVLYTTINAFGGYAGGNLAVLPMNVVQGLQFLVVGLGIVGSLFTAYQIARRAAPGTWKRAVLPHAVVIVLFGLLNIYLFTLPMVHRV
ncbi:4Fe-4S binding protein [Deinococcus ficus]|uniref:4Fe-4S binding protein n=1 Tax=Deinococcus ficus TaxID=317577 RepID=UPI0003B5F7F7|nr:4Fe-4S binding protein [Deinococcus ficus]